VVEERTQIFDPKNPQHVVSKSGRSFITFVGLQARLSDQRKMVVGSDSEILQNADDHNSNRWIIKYSLKIRSDEANVEGWFSAVGDAQVSGEDTKANVGSMVEPHALRMAETRAIVRILRVVTRSEYTAIEELG
jgi:hypothetical protein